MEHRFYELLKQDEEKDLLLGLNKQKLTASLLHRKLRSEGFDVGITTIQIEYKRYKNKNKEAFIKQQYAPGFRAEYDFHEVKVLIDDQVKKLYQATITLPHSNYIFVKHYQNQKFESFIDSLVTFIYIKSGKSTLANSLLKDKTMSTIVDSNNITQWIKVNCERFDVIMDAKLGKLTLNFIEGILHYKFNPKFEG